MPALVMSKKPLCIRKILSHAVSVTGDGANANALLYIMGVGSDSGTCRGS